MSKNILITCRNCKHFQELAGGAIGECRVNPPTPHPVMFSGEDLSSVDIQTMANSPAWWIYPVVKNSADSWCGQFSSNLPMKAAACH